MAVHNSSAGGNDHVYLGSQVLLLLYAFMVPGLKKNLESIYLQISAYLWLHAIAVISHQVRWLSVAMPSNPSLTCITAPVSAVGIGS